MATINDGTGLVKPSLALSAEVAITSAIIATPKNTQYFIFSIHPSERLGKS